MHRAYSTTSSPSNPHCLIVKTSHTHRSPKAARAQIDHQSPTPALPLPRGHPFQNPPCPALTNTLPSGILLRPATSFLGEPLRMSALAFSSTGEAVLIDRADVSEEVEYERPREGLGDW